MKPEEKALDLYLKFFNELLDVVSSKQCALIAIEEMLNNTYMGVRKYWLQVKEELNKL